MNCQYQHTAYTKLVANKMFYFVKKFMCFPEWQNIEPVLYSYGMHTDFDKACILADVTEIDIKQKLLAEANKKAAEAKVIEFKDVKKPWHRIAANYSFL